MMRDHKPISIADQVFEQLERDILTGKYPQGEVLSEMRLSSELGVSRTPIREAIRRLEQEHILEDTSRGLVVVGISRQDMLDIYEIRRQLEGLAAKRAAASVTDDVLSEMKEVLDCSASTLKVKRSRAKIPIRSKIWTPGSMNCFTTAAAAVPMRIR